MTPTSQDGRTCPTCEGAGGEDWRGLGWANCARCAGTGMLPPDHPYWTALEGSSKADGVDGAADWDFADVEDSSQWIRDLL